MKTSVYHITYYDYNQSLYIMFAKCNFRCLGCIRRRYVWDHHLYDRGGMESLRIEVFETLSLEEFKDIVGKVRVEKGLKRAVLGGGEPTADPLFCEIVHCLESMELEVAILTNGFLLDKVMSCIPRNCVIELSIKSIHPDKFSTYTGRGGDDLQIILKNMDTVYRSGLNLIVETVFIPNFNDVHDIELLARYIASRLDSSVPMIIDEYVPVLTAPWRKPMFEELIEAKKRAEKYLEKVTVRSVYTMKPIGKVHQIYPDPTKHIL